MCLLLNRALLTGLTLKSLLCRSSRTDSLINQLAVGSRFQSLRCSCWTGMLCFPPEPCTVTTPASRTQHPDLASCLALEWADFEMVFCLLYDGLSFFSSSLLPLPPGIVKFISHWIQVLAFFWSVVWINQMMASLDACTVLLIPLCAPVPVTRTFLQCFLHTCCDTCLQLCHCNAM